MGLPAKFVGIGEECLVPTTKPRLKIFAFGLNGVSGNGVEESCP